VIKITSCALQNKSLAYLCAARRLEMYQLLKKAEQMIQGRKVVLTPLKQKVC
jgi:hypothetical protein